MIRKLLAVTAISLGTILWSTSHVQAQTRPSPVPDGKPHTFETKDKQFLIDSQPITLIAGEMHFGRVQADDWETRIKQAKAMGLNTISFYLFWNQVEPKEGQFNFTGMNDVKHVLQLCQDNGMWCVLRPGPYCCAEVEYGGIPYWTLKKPEVKIRTTDPQWVAWCRDYINQIYAQVKDMQVSHGGPLLMVQIDNEIGVIMPPNNDYMVAMEKVFKEAGFDVPLYTCDPGFAASWRNPAFRLPGILNGRNGLKSQNDQNAAQIDDFPVYAPEVYTGWFSGWGQTIQHRTSLAAQKTWVNFLFDHHDSFCLYVFFGGTNYGFYNGCNTYLPVITSYDYDAPIDEAGRITERYKMLRDIYSSRLGITPPEPPADPPVIEIPAVTLSEHEPLEEWLPSTPTITSPKPITMENLDQDYGFVLYRHKFDGPVKGTLELRDAMDYTVVMVNGKTIATAFRGEGLDSNKISLDESGPFTLDLLIHNLGRISVPVSELTQHLARKGLVDGAYLDGQEIANWDMYSLPMPKIDNFKSSTSPHVGPTFYHGTFNVSSVGGTFLDMRNWGMGVVWVNGHNLGRYWDRGALRTLFLPRQWLNAGSNDITILELHDAPKTPEVSGGTKIIEEAPVAFKVRLDQAAPTSRPARNGRPGQ